MVWLEIGVVLVENRCDHGFNVLMMWSSYGARAAARGGAHPVLFNE
jgi:hypothetical protein